MVSVNDTTNTHLTSSEARDILDPWRDQVSKVWDPDHLDVLLMIYKHNLDVIIELKKKKGGDDSIIQEMLSVNQRIVSYLMNGEFEYEQDSN